MELSLAICKKKVLMPMKPLFFAFLCWERSLKIKPLCINLHIFRMFANLLGQEDPQFLSFVRGRGSISQLMSMSQFLSTKMRLQRLITEYRTFSQLRQGWLVSNSKSEWKTPKWTPSNTFFHTVKITWNLLMMLGHTKVSRIFQEIGIQGFCKLKDLIGLQTNFALLRKMPEKGEKFFGTPVVASVEHHPSGQGQSWKILC